MHFYQLPSDMCVTKALHMFHSYQLPKMHLEPAPESLPASGPLAGPAPGPHLAPL